MSYTPSLPVPLTDAQRADVRRHLGYGNMMSDTSTVAPYYRLAELEALNFKMDNLRTEEQAFVTNQLKAINSTYSAWIAAQANLANIQVAIITVNLNQMRMIREQYVMLCKDLAAWIGVSYVGQSGDVSRVIV